MVLSKKWSWCRIRMGMEVGGGGEWKEDSKGKREVKENVKHSNLHDSTPKCYRTQVWLLTAQKPILERQVLIGADRLLFFVFNSFYIIHQQCFSWRLWKSRMILKRLKGERHFQKISDKIKCHFLVDFSLLSILASLMI